MKPVKYALLILAALMTFSMTVDARTTSRRERERREQQRLRERREKQIKEYKKRQAQEAEARKKRIAKLEAQERERTEKMVAAREKKTQDAIAATQKAAREKALLGEYDTMVREVRMSSVQRQKLVEMMMQFKGMEPPKDARDDGREIERLGKLYKAAKGSQKVILARKLKEAKLREAKKKAEAAKTKSRRSKAVPTKSEQHQKIMGLLTPVQKLKWNGYKLAQDSALTFPGIKLTEPQLKRVRELCNEAAKGLPSESADPLVAAATRKTVIQKLRVQIIYEVMTPDQRAKARVV
ncbi:MAG: hypothetical protein HN350_19975 [Phycisphaerales bacterium]|nr:hypothetical protein [Phycisphaerales bacterium]